MKTDLKHVRHYISDGLDINRKVCCFVILSVLISQSPFLLN